MMRNANALVASSFGPIIINTYDSGVGRHIREYGYWALDEIQFIASLIKKLVETRQQVTFYDVGANIGTHTLAIAKTFPASVKIRAFEAQREIFNMLCGTIAINGISNAFLYNGAIGERPGDVIEIRLPDYGKTNNFGGLELIAPMNSDNQDMRKAGTEPVRTMALDEFEERVDFIKMDIEGMEDKALKGAVKTFDVHRPICFLETSKTDKAFVHGFFADRAYAGFEKADNMIAVPSEIQSWIGDLKQIF